MLKENVCVITKGLEIFNELPDLISHLFYIFTHNLRREFLITINPISKQLAVSEKRQSVSQYCGNTQYNAEKSRAFWNESAWFWSWAHLARSNSPILSRPQFQSSVNWISWAGWAPKTLWVVGLCDSSPDWEVTRTVTECSRSPINMGNPTSWYSISYPSFQKQKVTMF